MGGTWRAAAWLLAAATLAAAGDGDPPRPAGPGVPVRPDWFLALARDGRTVRIVPLRDGRLPACDEGATIDLPDDAQDPRTPPGLLILHDTDVLVLRTVRGGAQRWLRLHRDEGGRWRERAGGEWPGGWGPVGSADLDRDGEEDLVLLRREAPTGYAPYAWQVARGARDGSFVWGRSHPLPGGAQWTATAALGDVNGDGRPDLLHHVQPHGGTVPAELRVLEGVEGGFAAEARALVRGPTGASSIVPGRFTRGACWEVYLAADDDVPDLGQGYLWRRDAEGGWALAPSLDFSPGQEGDGSDVGLWTAVASDVDVDGKLDLVGTWREWGGRGRWRVVLHRGDGQGGFDDGVELLVGASDAPQPSLALPPDAGP